MKKRTLLWLPGWGFSKEIWRPFVNQLEVDASSDFVNWFALQSKEDITERAEKKLFEVSKCGRAKVSIIGWSLGSLVALDLAVRFCGKVDQLILFSATSCFTTQANYDIGWDSRIIRRMQQRLRREPQATLNDFYLQMLSEEDRKLEMEWSQLKGKKDSIVSLSFGLDFLNDTDYREKVAKIKQPIHLIHGEEDVICPLHASKWIVEQASGTVSLQTLPQTGHLPFLTQMNRCKELVQSYVNV